LLPGLVESAPHKAPRRDCGAGLDDATLLLVQTLAGFETCLMLTSGRPDVVDGVLAALTRRK